MRVVAIVQARMGSSRLPGKVLLDLAGRPMLARVVTRTARAVRVDEVVVATSVEPRDQPIAEACARFGWRCFRGSEQDVLDRYYQAAVWAGADVVVRITSDCPFIDPAIVDRALEIFGNGRGLDYVSNTLPPRTFPRGLDVEVLSRDALAVAWREDTNPAWREHVTPFIYRHPNRFTLQALRHVEDLSRLRWTVDTVEDLALVRHLYDHFGSDTFDWTDVLAVVRAHPEWSALNQHVLQREVE